MSMVRVGCAVLLLCGASAVWAESLEEGFAKPPVAAMPGVWWRWIDGNVTREGISRDLAEMARKGIRSVNLFDVGGGVPAGPAVRQVVSFRVAGSRPEAWDPLTGTHRDLPEWSAEGAVTHVPLRLEPSGSVFVVFRAAGAAGGVQQPRGPATGNEDAPDWKSVLEVTGPWQVTFAPQVSGKGASRRQPRHSPPRSSRWLTGRRDQNRRFGTTLARPPIERRSSCRSQSSGWPVRSHSTWAM
jgi:hypothetical protein